MGSDVLHVSVVAHRTPARQLESLMASLRGEHVRMRVSVVDNSPTDELRGPAEAMGAFYRHVENRGYGAGHNIAIRESISDGVPYHLVVNPDVCWRGEVLGPIYGFMEENPDVGQLIPRVYYPDGRLQHVARRLPSPADLLIHRFVPRRLARRHLRAYELPSEAYGSPFNCPYLLGSFMFFRTRALLREGLFDERFFMYPEDIDITRRLHRHWRTLYWPGAEIVHAHAAGSRHSWRLLRIHAVNMVRYFNKYGWLGDAERRRFNSGLKSAVSDIINKST